MPLSVPRRLRAPRQDGAFVADPPLDEAGTLLADNRQLLSVPGFDIFGRSWANLRVHARRAVFEAAQQYLVSAGESVPAFTDTATNPLPILMAGHQPELYHPGVWVKNFALNALARRHRCVPLNLVVDNDSAKNNALRVPVLGGAEEAERTHLQAIPFDAGVDEAPYEERRVHDERWFAEFPERSAAAFKGWGFEPMLRPFWADVSAQAKRTMLLGERFAAARRAWERRWGCHNLEVPVSAVCQTEPFAWFACHLLANLTRFHAVYNDCVEEYRVRYGLRSRNHPVPNLAAEGDWLETPFWAWRAGANRRGRLMARTTENHIELRVGAEAWPSLPRGPESSAPSAQRFGSRPTSSAARGSADSLVASWRQLESEGFKIRLRALTNTMFARLFLCDLFIHGIGGGKYDELTDEIIRRHYGVEPPGFLVFSATLLLPLPTYPVQPDDFRHLKRDLRDLHFNPQRHLADPDPAIQQLAAEKQAWIERQPATRRERRERFLRIRQLNERLLPSIRGNLERKQQREREYEQQLRANEILRRRDFAFCLFPVDQLESFCRRFSAPASLWGMSIASGMS